MYVNPLVEGTGPEAPVATDANGGDFSRTCETLDGLGMQSEQFPRFCVGEQWFKSCLHKDQPTRGTIWLMEPVTTATTVWTIAKTAGEVSKKLYEFGKSLKDRDLKQQIDEILDQVRELKQSASELEDENRGLREELRFKSDHYEFRNPFWYPKNDPNQALCAKCFSQEILAPMGAIEGPNTSPSRICLVCNNRFWG